MKKIICIMLVGLCLNAYAANQTAIINNNQNNIPATTYKTLIKNTPVATPNMVSNSNSNSIIAKNLNTNPNVISKTDVMKVVNFSNLIKAANLPAGLMIESHADTILNAMVARMNAAATLQPKSNYAGRQLSVGSSVIPKQMGQSVGGSGNIALMNEAIYAAKLIADELLIPCVLVPPEEDPIAMAACSDLYVEYIGELMILQPLLTLNLDGYESPYSESLFDICRFQVTRLVIPNLCMSAIE